MTVTNSVIAQVYQSVQKSGGNIRDASLAAYVASVMRYGGQAWRAQSPDDCRAFVTETMQDAVGSYLLARTDNSWCTTVAALLATDLSADDLSDFALLYDIPETSTSFRACEVTPPEIRSLAFSVLDPQPTQYLADLACGTGRFLVDCLQDSELTVVYGIDANPAAAALAQARMIMLGREEFIATGDCFAQPCKGTFDKVFLDCPFGMRLTYVRTLGDYLEPLRSGKSPMGRPASADWAFCKLAFDSLKDDGTAVVVIANGSTFNGGDESARRFFVENGMIRAVVSLPDRLYPNTSVGCTLLVLGRNRGGVRIVDATDLVAEGRRQNSLSDNGVEEIVRRLSTDGDNSKLVSREELASKDYVLYADRYLGEPPVLENATKLGNLINSIERGANLRARELDQLTTEEETGLYYLRLADISDGIISADLPHLREVDNSTERQWLKTGDLVLTKNGAPFKVAVADVPEGHTILANGNLYIVRLDTERVDPYFLAAFLSSEDGKRSLEQMAVGTAIPNLPLRNLKQIEVPVPSMDKQHEVANKYRAILDEIEVLKIRIDKARVRASEAYDEEMRR